MDNMETLPFLSQEFPDEYMLNDELSPATTVVTPSPLPGKEAPTITPDRIEPLCRGLAVQFEKVIEENDKTFEACPVASASTGPQGLETNKEDTEKISQPTMEEKKVSLQVEADQKGSAIEGGHLVLQVLSQALRNLMLLPSNLTSQSTLWLSRWGCRQMRNPDQNLRPPKSLLPSSTSLRPARTINLNRP
jgi:hypothetical protein